MKTIILTLPFLFALLHASGQGRQIVKNFDQSSINNYWVYLPEGYHDNPDKEWLLMLFLHGAGERGDDIQKVKVHGPPKLVDQGKEFPFIIIAPQCPEGRWWWRDELMALLEKTEEDYRVDQQRVYLTGLSMGGFGSWNLASAYPDKFSAVVPICGGGNPDVVCNIKDVPVWVFHGQQDHTVPIERSEEMVNALKACNGNVKFTVYPEAGHDSWTESYNNDQLYEWLLDQQLREE